MVQVSSFVPAGVESKLPCTMLLIHVLHNSASVMTWRMWLNDLQISFQIDGSMIVGQRVQYTMDYTMHAHDPSQEEVQVAARVQEATVNTSPVAQQHSADCT